MKHTLFHIHTRSLILLEALSKSANHVTLMALQNELETLCDVLSNNNSDETLGRHIALEFRETAVRLHAQSSFLLNRQQRRGLKSICIGLVCLAQTQERLLTPTYLQKYQQKIEPLQNESHRFETRVLRLLCQQCSLFLSGHKGVCAIAAKEWLADNFMTDSVALLGSHFIKKVEFRKQELCYLYRLEKERTKNALTFSLVAGLHRITTGHMMLALIGDLSNHKPSCFLITLAHFRKRLFHSVGCKYGPENIQWFDSDCGIFESHNKKAFASWLNFYLEKNKYQEKFSFFTVHKGERSPSIGHMLENGVNCARHFIA